MSQTAEGGHPHTPARSPHPELDEVNIMAAFSQKGVGTFTFLSPVSPNVRMSKVPKPNLNKHMQDHTNTSDLQNLVHDVTNILPVTISERFTKGKCFLERINFWQQIQGKFGLCPFVRIFNCVTSRVWGKWEESTRQDSFHFNQIHTDEKKDTLLCWGQSYSEATLSALRKWERWPKDATWTHVRGDIQWDSRSTSWQHFASSELELSFSLCQLPRTKEWAKCQNPT